MGQDIGYQDGIGAFEDWFRKLSEAIDQHNTWVAQFEGIKLNPDAKVSDLPSPPKLPKIPLEGPKFDENNLTTWPWPRKFFRRTMEFLKNDYDARTNPSPPPPNGGNGGGDEPPPPPVKRYAPRTHNLGGRDQDPRFCMKPEYGVKDMGGYYQDEMGCKYDKEHGLNTDGTRDRNYMVPGLKGADSMDGMEPCDPYSANGISVPPYPGDPIAQTGSYHR